MSCSAHVVADSLSETGIRLTTLRVQAPVIALMRLQTYRKISVTPMDIEKIPVERLIQDALDDPVRPRRWRGQNGTTLRGLDFVEADSIWSRGRDRALITALEMLIGLSHVERIFDYKAKIGEGDQTEFHRKVDESLALFRDVNPPPSAHTKHIYQILAPYVWHTALVTASEWDRILVPLEDSAVFEEWSHIVTRVQNAMDNSRPHVVKATGWHVPFLRPSEASLIHTNEQTALRISGARCAHNSEYVPDASDINADIGLFNAMVLSGNMTPLEHIARPLRPGESVTATSEKNRTFGNLHGWKQLCHMMNAADALS